MRIEHEVSADLAAQPELLAIGRQQELDCGRVESDAVIEGGHAVPLVDASNREHRSCQGIEHSLFIAPAVIDRRLPPVCYSVASLPPSTR